MLCIRVPSAMRVRIALAKKSQHKMLRSNAIGVKALGFLCTVGKSQLCIIRSDRRARLWFAVLGLAAAYVGRITQTLTTNKNKQNARKEPLDASVKTIYVLHCQLSQY